MDAATQLQPPLSVPDVPMTPNLNSLQVINIRACYGPDSVLGLETQRLREETPKVVCEPQYPTRFHFLHWAVSSSLISTQGHP